MKKLLPLLACTLLIVSCDALKGPLDVREPITLKAKKTGLFQSGTKEVTIPAGVHDAKLNPTSKTNLNLELKVNGKEIKIPFNIARGTVIPEVEGILDITSHESGQAVDLHAEVNSESSSYEHSANETCVRGYIPERRCVTIPASRSCHEIPAREICHDRRGNGERVCRTEPARTECETRPSVTNCDVVQIPVYGSQIVNYETTATTRFVVVDLLLAGKEVGQFKSQNTSNSSIRLGSSRCR